jgi:hypothetical protein
MSLIEDAKQAYTKDQLENKEDKEKDIKKFIEDSIQCIKEKFGDNLNIEVISEKDDNIAFLVDGLKMRVRRSQGYYSIYLVQICQKCCTEYEDIIINLKNIGKAIQEGHTSYDCKKILKEREPVKELTTEEKLIDALRAFVQENLSE